MSILHPNTEKLVDDFAAALKTKLARAEKKYGYSDNWRTDNWEIDCQRELARHVQKGDPLDVAAYAAFCWARGYRTATTQEPDGWLAVRVNNDGGIVMPYGPLHPHPERPNDPRYQWAPFYLGEPK